MDPASMLMSDAAYKAMYDASWKLKVSFVAAVCVGVWDIIVTHNQERHYIWPRRSSVVKYAFLLGRYYFLFAFLPLCGVSVFAMYSDDICARAFWIHPFSCVLAMLPTQIILVFRTLAVYNFNRWLAALLISLTLAGQVAAFVILSRFTAMGTVPGITGCNGYIPSGYDFLYTFWLPALVVEVLSFALVFGRFLVSRKNTLVGSTDLLGRLAADSLIYFVPITALAITNTVLFALAPEIRPLAMYPYVSLSVTLSSRLVLNLHRDMEDEGMTSISSLQSRLMALFKGGSGGSTVGMRTAQTDSRSSHGGISKDLASHIVVLTETTKVVGELPSSSDIELAEPQKIRF